MKLSHESSSTKTSMDVNLYLPPASKSKKVPVLIFLSGLTVCYLNCICAMSTFLVLGQYLFAYIREPEMVPVTGSERGP